MGLPDILDVVRARESRPEDLQARVRWLEHRESIRDLLAAYCYFEDHRRWEEMVSLFTEDCERTIAGTLDQTVKGREALLAACRATEPLQRSAGHWGAAIPHDVMRDISIRHILATTLIKIGPSGERARVVAYYQIIATRGAGEEFRRGSHEGTFHFDLRLIPGAGEWRIERQVVWTNHATNPLFMAQDVSSSHR